MALCNSKSPNHFRIQQLQPVLFLDFLSLTIFLFLLFPFSNPVSFSLSSFESNGHPIYYEGCALVFESDIRFTECPLVTNSNNFTIGRAVYAFPIQLWDSKTGNLTDFNTNFTVNMAPYSAIRGGLTFFLSPYNASIPIDSSDGYLGLFEDSTAFNNTNNQIVAVEFDVYQDPWDPSPLHVGIDVNSIKSVDFVNLDSLFSYSINASVNYDSTTKTLSVNITYPDGQGSLILSHVVDLRNVLPEWVSVGFSGSNSLTGYDEQYINSWTFHSTLGNSSKSTSPSNPTSGGSPSTTTGPKGSPSTTTGPKTNRRLVVYLPVGGGVGALICGVGLVWYMKQQKMICSSWPSRSQVEDGLSGTPDHANPQTLQGSSIPGSDQTIEEKEVTERREKREKSELPKYFVLKSDYNNRYLQLCHLPEDGEDFGFLQFSGREAGSPYAKFQVEMAKSGNGLVHIKCCHNNKYWVRKSQEQSWILAEADIPEESQSKWSCTLFRLEYIDDDSEAVRFWHVQLRQCLWSIKSPLGFCLFAGSDNADEDCCDVYTIIDWNSLTLMDTSNSNPFDNTNTYSHGNTTTNTNTNSNTNTNNNDSSSVSSVHVVFNNTTRKTKLKFPF